MGMGEQFHGISRALEVAVGSVDPVVVTLGGSSWLLQAKFDLWDCRSHRFLENTNSCSGRSKGH